MEISKISQILKQLMNEVKVTEAELSRRTAIPQPTLHRILSGATRSPRGNSLSPLANFFSITISQLIGDDPLPKDRIPGTYNPGLHGWTTVPLLSWEDAINWPQLKGDLINSNWEYWASTDADVGPNAFALIVQGDAMSPRFVDGTILIIDPAYAPQNQDFIVVHLKGQRQVTFKQLLIDGCDQYLKPLNAEFNTVLLDEQNDCFIGVMIQSRSDFRKTNPLKHKVETQLANKAAYMDRAFKPF